MKFEEPVSFSKVQIYQKNLEAAKNEQMAQFEKRKEKNAEYERLTTEKILRSMKQKFEEENKKKSNPEVYYAPAEPKFLVAVLIKSQIKIGPKVKKILELLRLTSIHSAVIIRNNKVSKKMLQLAKDYIAYGSIDYELLRKMVYTRGFGRKGHTKISLTNEDIEDVFEGKYRCIEELVNVIYTGGEDFKQVNRFFYTFKLNTPRGGFSGKKSVAYTQGGQAGNHKHLLGELVERML